MTLTGTNTYIVGAGELVVVDPGPDIREHVEAILETARPLGRIVSSFVTHSHSDHLPAAVRLRERLGVPVRGHALLPDVDQPLSHDEVVDVGEVRLRALATPGHTADHMCFLLEQERMLFTGDLIVGHGTVVIGEARNDLALYLESLQLVAEFQARMILPGHGPVVDDPAEKVGEYLKHREERQGQILNALEAGPLTVDGLTGRLYSDVAPALQAMAARNVRAHLCKLEQDGRVVAQADGVWRLVNGKPR